MNTLSRAVFGIAIAGLGPFLLLIEPAPTHAQIKDLIPVGDCKNLLVSWVTAHPNSPLQLRRPFSSFTPFVLNGQNWVALNQDGQGLLLMQTEENSAPRPKYTTWRTELKSAQKNLQPGTLAAAPLQNGTWIRSGGASVLFQEPGRSTLYRAFLIEGRVSLLRVFTAGGIFGNNQILDLSENGEKFITVVRNQALAPVRLEVREITHPQKIVHSTVIPPLSQSSGPFDTRNNRISARFFFDDDQMIAVSHAAEVRSTQDPLFETTSDWTVRGELRFFSETLQKMSAKTLEPRDLSPERAVNIAVSADRSEVQLPELLLAMRVTGYSGSLLSEVPFKKPLVQFDRLTLADFKTENEKTDFQNALQTRLAPQYWPTLQSSGSIRWAREVWSDFKNSILKRSSRPQKTFDEIYSEYRNRTAPPFVSLAISPDGRRHAIGIPALGAVAIYDVFDQKTVATHFFKNPADLPEWHFHQIAAFSPDGHSLWMDHAPLPSLRGSSRPAFLKTGITLWNFEPEFSK